MSEIFKVSVNVNHCCGGCRSGSCRRSLLQHRLLLLIMQLFPLLLLYLLVLVILPPPPRDVVLMTALGSLLCTCAHQLHARKDRHETVRTPWHTAVAEVPDPLCEVHTVWGKCGIVAPISAPISA
eukprot:366455-Chlamydomonas_euryale.AAC.9